jgi:hypothetical protein
VPNENAGNGKREVVADAAAGALNVKACEGELESNSPDCEPAAAGAPPKDRRGLELKPVAAEEKICGALPEAGRIACVLCAAEVDISEIAAPADPPIEKVMAGKLGLAVAVAGKEKADSGDAPSETPGGCGKLEPAIAGTPNANSGCGERPVAASTEKAGMEPVAAGAVKEKAGGGKLEPAAAWAPSEKAG